MILTNPKILNVVGLLLAVMEGIFYSEGIYRHYYHIILLHYALLF